MSLEHSIISDEPDFSTASSSTADLWSGMAMDVCLFWEKVPRKSSLPPCHEEVREDRGM